VYLCAYVFGYRYLCDVAPIGVKVCTTVDLSSGHKVNSTLAYSLGLFINTLTIFTELIHWTMGTHGNFCKGKKSNPFLSFPFSPVLRSPLPPAIQPYGLGERCRRSGATSGRIKLL